MPVILALVGQSMNDALGAATRAHQPMFERLGYEFREVNFSKPDASEVLNNSVAEGDIEFVFSAMGMGGDFRTKNQDDQDLNLWEAIHVPFISLLGDIPGYFFDRHVAATSWHAPLYFFPDHLLIRKRLPFPASICGVIPPIPFDATRSETIDFKKKESGRLLFLKNGNDPEQLVRVWREGLPAPTFLLLAELASTLASSLNSDAATDIDAAVTSAFASRGWDIEGSLQLRLLFMAQLDDYLRRVKSTMLGRVLAEFPVDIQGFNWEHVDFSGKRARHLPGGDYVASGDQIRQSLGVIDMSPNTRLAPHDRPMRAMGLHTLCLTNRQTFFEENFADWREFSFRFDEESIRDRVSSVIAKPKQFIELGRAVAEEFAKRHSPEDFGQFLIDTASHVRASNLNRPAGFQPYFVWPPAVLQGKHRE